MKPRIVGTREPQTSSQSGALGAQACGLHFGRDCVPRASLDCRLTYGKMGATDKPTTTSIKVGLMSCFAKIHLTTGHLGWYSGVMGGEKPSAPARRKKWP